MAIVKGAGLVMKAIIEVSLINVTWDSIIDVCCVLSVSEVQLQ